MRWFRGEYGNKICFLLFCSTFHFCRGYEGLDPEFRSLVWQGVKLLPDPEHYCNIKFSNYAVEAICEDTSKWGEREREWINEWVCTPKDLARKTETKYWHLLNKNNTRQNTGLVNYLTLFQLHAAQANDRFTSEIREENKRTASTRTQAHFSAFLFLVLSQIY